MRFFLTCLNLQIRVQLKKLPVLLGMAAAMMLLSGLLAAGAVALLETERFSGITVAVASEDDDPRLEPYLSLLGGMPEVKAFGSIVQVSYSEAAAMVEEEKAGAAMIFPARFLETYGEKMTARLIVDSSRPVETAYLTKMAAATVRMIAASQEGMRYSVEAAQHASGGAADLGTVANQSSRVFFEWVLGHGEIYREVIVNTAGQLTVFQHYLLCAALGFAFLSTPILFRALSLNAQRGWMRRLSAGGFSAPAYAAAQIAAFAAALVPMLVLLLAGVGIAGGRDAGALLPQAIAGLLLAAAFMAGVGYLCCNAGGIAAAVGINFALCFAMTALSGGLVPLVMLPAQLAALAPYVPFTWIWDLMAGVYGVPADPRSVWLLLAASPTMTSIKQTSKRSAITAERSSPDLSREPAFPIIRLLYTSVDPEFISRNLFPLNPL